MKRWMRWVIFAVAAVFFFGPLLSMLDFSTKDPITGQRSAKAWSALITNDQVTAAIIQTLLLAASTVLLMLLLLLPTIIWVKLRLPRMRRVIEFMCLLPLTIPPLVIVVGVSGVYAWVNYFFGYSPVVLTFAYVILVLPYAYRSIDASLSAIDATTLAEAARSLGAGWFTVIFKVIVPNLKTGILSASFISIALVLGEFVFASLLNYQTLPVVIELLGKSSAQVSVAAALATILFASTLLLVLSLASGGSRRTKGVGA